MCVALNAIGSEWTVLMSFSTKHFFSLSFVCRTFVHSFRLQCSFLFPSIESITTHESESVSSDFDSFEYKAKLKNFWYFKWILFFFCFNFSPTNRWKKYNILKLPFENFHTVSVWACRSAWVCVCILNESCHLINSASRRFFIQFYSFLRIDKKPGETMKKANK